jgi:hypothetical protein
MQYIRIQNIDLCLIEEQPIAALQKMEAFALGCFFDLCFRISFECVCMRLGASGKGWEGGLLWLPLSEGVKFATQAAEENASKSQNISG